VIRQKTILLLLVSCTLYGSDMQYNRGEMLYFSKGCNACHGPSGEGGSDVPRLAQKRQNDLRHKLSFFRAGEVNSQRQEMMVQFALKLSDDVINDITYFLSHHKGATGEDVSSELLGGFGS